MTKLSALESQFVDPPWHERLDVAAALNVIPKSSTLSGLFFRALITELQNRDRVLPNMNEPYLAFRFYPLRDFAQLMCDAAPVLHPRLSLRQALRKMGRAAPRALLESTVGKVVLGSAEGVHAILNTVSQTYPINMRPGHAELVERAPNSAVVRLTDVAHFLDSHHVGVLEATLHYARVKAQVRIRPLAPGAMDFLCTW